MTYTGDMAGTHRKGSGTDACGKDQDMRFKEKTALFLLTLTSVSLLLCGTAYADFEAKDTGNIIHVKAAGEYENWEGITNVPQFEGPDGNFCYAIAHVSQNRVDVYMTNVNMDFAGKVELEMQHPLFGTALCDKDGNFYLVTGEENTTSDRNRETVFISKYDMIGEHIKTVGDNGSSSIEDYFDDGFYTQKPFEAGNCDAAITGDILTVEYARKMYNGHQSNSVFSVNIKDMSKVNMGLFYESHSFAQRVVPVDKGFVFLSEGDCYGRAFTLYSAEMSGGAYTKGTNSQLFNFWVNDSLNNNYAHTGGLAALHDGRMAFAAQSARSLNENALNERENIFLQVFDPYADLNSPASYTTSGERSGKSGMDGSEDVTNHGVEWLTDIREGAKIKHVQIAALDGQLIFVLYHYWEGIDYKGVYGIIMDDKGDVIVPATLLDEKATLNPYEMPVCANGAVTWVGNSYNDKEDRLYIYSYKISYESAKVTTAPAPIEGLEYDGNTHTLVTEGAAEGGEIQYVPIKDDTRRPADEEFSSTVPEGRDGGTYYVWYRALGDENHYNSPAACVTVTIKGGDPSGSDDPSGKDDPSVKIPEGLGNSLSENKPMEYRKEERSGFEIYYCYALPFWGKQKSDIRVFGEPGVIVVYEGNTYNATKVKINKKTGLYQITGLYGVDRSVVKLLKTATKGGLGLPYKVNPFCVRNDTGIFTKYKADGSLSTVKVLIGEKYYKAKKTEWSYDDSLQTIFFSGNLDGSYVIPQ